MTKKREKTRKLMQRRSQLFLSEIKYYFAAYNSENFLCEKNTHLAIV